MTRWMDIFKKRSPESEPDLRLRWFGKLPTYGDYDSSPVDKAWAEKFNNWILRGSEIYLNRQKEGNRHGKPALLPISACALRLPQSDMTVLTSIQDYGGDNRGRPFPIAFYVGVPNESLPGPKSSQAVVLARFLRDLMALKKEVIRFLRTPGSFKSTFGGREFASDALGQQVEDDDAWFPQARQISFEEWFGGLHSAAGSQSMPAWLNRVAKWGDAIAGMESDSFQPTLTFPLAAGFPLEIQVAAWLRWLELRMDIGRRFCSLVVTGDPWEGEARLSVVARTLIEEDFLLMTPLAKTLAYADDLTVLKPENERNVADEAASPVKEPEGELPASLADFLGQR